MDTTISTLIMIITVLIWIVWDLILYVKRGKDKNVSTISMLITDFAWYSPALPLAAGILMGHWFW